MIAAICTTLFFAFSAVTGQRVAMRLGGAWGNLMRLLLAAIILGLLVLVLTPDAIRWPSFQWFFLSGVIGFGIGDVALFTAYERIGSRLTILLNLCLAPLFAMTMEWLWLGNGLGPRVVLCAILVLVGVAMAIRPGAKSRQKVLRGSLRGWPRCGRHRRIRAGHRGCHQPQGGSGCAGSGSARVGNYGRFSTRRRRSPFFRRGGLADPPFRFPERPGELALASQPPCCPLAFWGGNLWAGRRSKFFPTGPAGP